MPNPQELTILLKLQDSHRTSANLRLVSEHHRVVLGTDGYLPLPLNGLWKDAWLTESKLL